jgi:hypothetical protein
MTQCTFNPDDGPTALPVQTGEEAVTLDPKGFVAVADVGTATAPVPPFAPGMSALMSSLAHRGGGGGRWPDNDPSAEPVWGGIARPRDGYTDAEIFTAEVADLLDAAHAEMKRLGWTKGRDHDPTTGRVCLRGAIREATLPDLHDSKYRYTKEQFRMFRVCVEAVRRYLVHADLISVYEGTVPGFNDRDDTTERDVFAALEKTAIWIRERI